MKRNVVGFMLVSMLLGNAGLAVNAIDPPAAEVSETPRDAKSRAREMAAKAIAYLKTQQDASGGWAVPPQGPKYPAITGLVLQGMLAQEGIDASDASAAKGIKWLVDQQQSDGGIYDRILPVYNTAISLTALARADTPAAKAAIKPAQEFLKKLQYFENTEVLSGNTESAKPVSEADPFYGGWGYGNRGRPDLSNTAFALEALRASGVEASDAAYARATKFLQRCQMDDRFNDSAFAKGSRQGGFIYATSVNKDDRGGGQSFAGEIVESLSGPPGSVAQFAIKIDDAKKPALNREQLLEKLRTAFAADADEDVKAHAENVRVVLGASSDGKSSTDVTIRSGITDPAELQAAVQSALKEHLAGEVTAHAVKAWQGESHLRAYGTMGYAGLKSYLYAGLSRDDARVQAVVDWARRNYTLRENPGVGTDGFYYYILMFGRAMGTYGESEFLAADGDGVPRTREWKTDLVDRLAELQQPDGSFKSVDNRWMEDNTVLITAYALIALGEAGK